MTVAVPTQPWEIPGGGKVTLDPTGHIPWALMSGVRIPISDNRFAGATNRLQAAMDYADANGGGDVIVDLDVPNAGNMTPRSEVNLIGEGNPIITATAGNTDPILYRPPGSAGTFKNVTIKGIFWVGESAPAVDSNQIAIYIRGGTITNVKVEECWFSNFRSSAVHIGECTSVRYKTLNAINCATAPFGRNVFNIVANPGDTWGDFEIDDVMIDTTGAGGVSIVTTAGGFVTKATINNIRVYNATNWAAVVVEANGSHSDIAITNVIAENCSIGVNAADTGGGGADPPTYADFQGITIDNFQIKSTLPGSKGLVVQSSNTTVGAGSVNVRGEILEFGGKDATHRATNQVLKGPISGTINGDASGSNGYFGEFADKVTLGDLTLELESGAAISRGIRCVDITKLKLDSYGIGEAGRHGVELTDCPDAKLRTGTIYNPGTESNIYSGIAIIGAAGRTVIRNHDIEDTRGGSAHMKYGVDTSGVTSGTVRTFGMDIAGYLTQPVNPRNVPLDQAQFDDFDGQAGAVAPSQKGWSISSGSLGAQARVWASRLYARRDILVTNLRFVVTIAAGADHSVDVGIYSSDGGTKLASSGATTGKLNSTGSKSVNLTAPFTLRAGTSYLIAIESGDPSTLGGAVATILAAALGGQSLGMRMFGTNQNQLLMGSVDTTFPLPAGIFLGNNANYGPYLAVCES